MVSVADDIERVFVRSENAMPLSATVPPCAPLPNPKSGAGGAAVSATPAPPICHRVTMEFPGSHSRLLTLAARPVICATSPLQFGIANCAVALVVEAPGFQPLIATAK